ncbi:uncharacterized protein [Gossypium hirsutum]|uniref:Uncharacterized protein n=1 Tax=Gossypium hirsutum TaxID=3635 RepID=A0ABM3BC06_GOSHI|nr:uncharacterized protein LOC121224969 [Gossypium hirsutum]
MWRAICANSPFCKKWGSSFGSGWTRSFILLYFQNKKKHLKTFFSLKNSRSLPSSSPGPPWRPLVAGDSAAVHGGRKVKKEPFFGLSTPQPKKASFFIGNDEPRPPAEQKMNEWYGGGRMAMTWRSGGGADVEAAATATIRVSFFVFLKKNYGLEFVLLSCLDLDFRFVFYFGFILQLGLL